MPSKHQSRDWYRDIRQRYKFSIPREYRTLEAAGLFKLRRPITKSTFKPGGYLWLNDLEWYRPREILEHVFEPYQLPGFVPFAFSGGGDYWCWQVKHTTKRGARVVRCWRDSEMATVYAPDFPSALYRHALEYCAEEIEDDDGLDRHYFLERWATELAPIFPSSWLQRLKALSKSRKNPILSCDEAEKIIKKDLRYASMGADTRWQKPCGGEQ